MHIGAVGAFRDIGLQLFDAFRIRRWETSYAFMIGNGIRGGDVDGDKDLYFYLSMERLFGGKGIRRDGLKFFGWYNTGKRSLQTEGAGNYTRRRWGGGATFRKRAARAGFEYIGAEGMIFNGTDGGAVPGATANNGTGKASFNLLPNEAAHGLYVDFGYRPLRNWELGLRYDSLNRGTKTPANERRFQTLTLGMQFFINKMSRVLLNYEIRSADAPGFASPDPVNRILSAIDNRFSMQLVVIF